MIHAGRQKPVPDYDRTLKLQAQIPFRKYIRKVEPASADLEDWLI